MNKTTNENIEIRRLPYTRMLKFEMADYAEEIISIVERHNPDSAIIKPLFGLLLARKPELAMLRLSYGIDIERLRKDKLKGLMTLTISTFKLNVRVLSNSSNEVDMHVVESAIDNYLCYFKKCKNEVELNQKVAGFLDLLDSNKMFAVAIAKFNLMGDLNKIKRAHTLFNEASRKRVKMLSKRPKKSTKNIIRELFYTIDNLFKGVEIAQVIHSITDAEANSDLGAEGAADGPDFTPLINELRQLSDMYYKSFSIRKGNNKRNFEKKQTRDSALNDIPNASENVFEAEDSAEEEAATMSENAEYHPSEVYAASIKKMYMPAGKSSAVNLKRVLDNQSNGSSKRRLLKMGRRHSS